MKKTVLILIQILISNVLFPQIANIIPTSSSIANTSVSDIKNWSGFNNPAMLGYIEQSELGINYENKYVISELSTKSVQLGISTNAINAGLSYSYFGYSLYHEMMVGLGFARNFSDKFAMGVQFNYYTAYFAASNSYRGALLPQLGLSVRLSPAFSIGFHSFNPFQNNINSEYVLKRIPSVFSLGTEYNFAPELVWRTQVDKEVSSNYRFATGFEYQMLERLSIKLGGYGSDYLVPCLGFGLNSGRFLLGFNCELHPILGLNTMAALKYRFGSLR